MVSSCWRMLLAESKKTYRNQNRNISSLISMLIWPLISYVNIIFTYKSFDVNSLVPFGITSESELLIFLTTGAMVYNCFWITVQGGIDLTQDRQNGTLEMVFLTPVNRLILMYTKAIASQLNTVILSAIFLFVSLLSVTFSLAVPVQLFIAYCVVVICATIWGGFIGTIFLIGRDATFLFTICDEPMRFFSGSMVPTASFPLIFKWISFLFPATYCIKFIQSIVLRRSIVLGEILGIIISTSLLVIITIYLLQIIEKRNRKNGGLQLY